MKFMLMLSHYVVVWQYLRSSNMDFRILLWRLLALFVCLLPVVLRSCWSSAHVLIISFTPRMTLLAASSVDSVFWLRSENWILWMRGQLRFVGWTKGDFCKCLFKINLKMRRNEDEVESSNLKVVKKSTLILNDVFFLQIISKIKFVNSKLNIWKSGVQIFMWNFNCINFLL
jgi:hypothetical protein